MDKGQHESKRAASTALSTLSTPKYFSRLESFELTELIWPRQTQNPIVDTADK